MISVGSNSRGCRAPMSIKEIALSSGWRRVTAVPSATTHCPMFGIKRYTLSHQILELFTGLLSVCFFGILKEPIPVTQLVREIATVMQEFTQSGGVRPFGVSLLVAGCWF